MSALTNLPQNTLNGQLSPLPTPERDSLITEWYARLDRAIAWLTELRDFIDQARALPASMVDGRKLIALEEATYEVIEKLLPQFDTAAGEYDDMFKLLTGRSHWHLYAEYSILNRRDSFNFWEREIEAIFHEAGTDADRQQAKHLLDLLDSVHGQGVQS